jgi:glucosamine--fructose-6-phosphate aminotransferase (isomerizing)
MFLASDVPALLQHTRDVVFMLEGEMAELTRDGYRMMNARRRARGAPSSATWTPSQAEKGGFKHFMLKEISRAAAGDGRHHARPGLPRTRGTCTSRT